MFFKPNDTLNFLVGHNLKPRYHGNGFTQLYLAPDVRLHVWHPELKPLRDHNAMIHNHRYDVRSTVYSGRLLQTAYVVDTEAPAGEHDVRIIQLVGASDAHKTPEQETGITGVLRVRDQYELGPGVVYRMNRPFFHSSDHIDKTPIVTIFERENKAPDGEWAQVLCGINDAIATHAFAPETQPPAERMWRAIEDGLHIIGQDAHARIRRIVSDATILAD